jgi:hypothetical protein
LNNSPPRDEGIKGVRFFVTAHVFFDLTAEVAENAEKSVDQFQVTAQAYHRRRRRTGSTEKKIKRKASVTSVRSVVEIEQG